MARFLLSKLSKAQWLRPAIYAGLLACLWCSNVAFAQQNSTQSGAKNPLLQADYRQALYYYFQGDFYHALSQIALIEQRYPLGLRGIAEPGVDPELLKGGMSLAWGLDDQAQQIFERLLSVDDVNTSQQTRAQAWQLLAKALYQKQQYQGAAKALQYLSAELATKYLDRQSQDEVWYLKSQLSALLSNDYAPEQLRQQMSADSLYRQYVTYNQALTSLQQGQHRLGLSLLEELSSEPKSIVNNLFFNWFSPLYSQGEEEEKLALRDRANLTLGYSQLQLGDNAKAKQAFQKVRLNSLDSQAALLGLGWSAAYGKEYQMALSIWDNLKHSAPSSEYVLESYLASAYAYEHAFAPTQALGELEQGLQHYQSELVALQSMQDMIAKDSYLLSLAAAKQDSQATPENGRYFAAVMSDSVFVSSLAALQENLQLRQRLSTWHNELDNFRLMLQERKVETQDRIARLKGHQSLDKLADFRRQREKLSSLIEQAQQPGGQGLLTPSPGLVWQHRLHKAIETEQAIQMTKQALAQPALSGAYQQRLQRIRGLLLLQDQDQFSERLWDARKQLIALDKVLDKTQAQQQNLVKLLSQSPEFSQQEQQITALQLRVDEQLLASDGLQQQLLKQMRALFNDKLQQYVVQLNNYIMQSQLAVVRLNDQAYRKANGLDQVSNTDSGALPDVN
jgi:hypothetical protein